MIFRSVYGEPIALELLYLLMSERTPDQSISHKEMPTLERHRQFVMSKPYLSWMLMEDDNRYDRLQTRPRCYVGSVYVTRAYEVGIFVFRAHKRRGYGREALEWARNEYRDHRLLANINPANEASIAFFARHGARHIQNTYEI